MTNIRKTHSADTRRASSRVPGRASRRIQYALLTVAALLFLLPFALLILQSFNETQGIFRFGTSQLGTGNYGRVFSIPQNLSALGIGLTVALTAAAAAVVLSSSAAYGISRLPQKSKADVIRPLCLCMGIPLNFVVVPLYAIFFRLRLPDSLAILTLVFTACSLPYAIWTITRCTEDLSSEVEDAAVMDGAGRFQTLTRVFLPALLPCIGTVFINAFITSWGNFVVPFVLISSSDKMPVSVVFYRIFSAGTGSVSGVLAAYGVIYALPLFILYLASRGFMAKTAFAEAARK